MDQTYLERRRQEELARAASATCDAARSSHQELARRFAAELERRFPSSKAA